MARNFDDDFETNDFSAWDSTSGSPSTVTSPVLFGTYAYEANATEWALIDIGPNSGTIYMRWYWRPASPWEVNRMYSFERTNNTPALRVETISGPNRLRLMNVITGTSVDGAETIVLDTLYRIETRCLVDNSVGEMELRLYDTPDPGSLLDTLTITGEDTATGGQQKRHRLGPSSGGFTGLWYFDEYGTNDDTGGAPDNTWLGPVTPAAADLPPLIGRHLNPVQPHEPHDLVRMLPRGGKEVIPYVDPLVAKAYLEREVPYGIRTRLHA